MNYRIAAGLFAKALGIIYLIAFVSCGVQVNGLIGSNGILPVPVFLGAVWRQAGSSAFWDVPTVFWWAHTDFALQAVCWSGAVIAIAAALAKSHSIAQRAAFAILFIFYLSLVSAGQIFMGYQWDYLLLETGFLAIFLVPSLPRIWLFQWLLFRLVFESGVVKLTSHDATWSSLTALTYHYQTQPLPTPLAWYMAQLPLWFQKTSTVFVFAVELILPFMIFAPRRFKQAAAAGIVVLQLLILLTGNYTFFNWLTIALCLFLLDDRFFHNRPVATPRANRYVSIALLVFVAVISGSQLLEMFSIAPPAPIRIVARQIAPFGLINQYGLFASMTTTRPEISVEGSNDATHWEPYLFPDKAGPLNRSPSWVAPYQPRLDWQMWFASLGDYHDNPWFTQFLLKLLQGSKPVLALLARDPFHGTPPKYIRAITYEYRFTDFATRRKTGDWWTREPTGTYFPAVSLK